MPPLEPPQKVAVTGANGFIGAHCVLALLREGFAVVAAVRDPSDAAKTDFLRKEAEKIIGATDRLSFGRGDLFAEGAYDEAFAGCDGVLHTAAVVEIGDVKDAEAQIIRPSVEGTANVLASAKKHAGTIRRFVHLSSCAAVQNLDKPKDHVFTEVDWNTWSTAENGDPYGYAKTRAERLVWDAFGGIGSGGDRSSSSSSEIDAAVLNPVVVLGPVLSKAHTKSSTSLIREIIYGNPLNNYNASFVDVRDVASAAAACFTKDEAGGKRFIICGTQPSSTLILNDHVRKSHPSVRGSPPKYPPAMIAFLSGLGQIPVLGKVGLNEFQRAHTSILTHFDATRSKDTLGIKYTDIVETCRESVESMEPYLHAKNCGGEAKAR